jgi:hypothetical protein
MACRRPRDDTWRVRSMSRWVWREPWMAFTACVTTVCVMTVIAIRWLAVLGVVRDYTVTHTSGSLPPAGGGFSYSTSSYHRHLGLLSGPSTALTQLDHWTWRIGLVAGILWMARLGLRSANRRIGTLRGLAVVFGFGAFVVTGVAHGIAEVVIPSVRTRDRMHLLITIWCFAAVITAVLVMATVSVGVVPPGGPTLGDHAVIAPVGWSIARNALHLLVAFGGWAIALSLTRRWIRAEEPSDETSRLLTV